MSPRMRRRLVFLFLAALLMSVFSAGAGVAAAPELGCAGVTQVPLSECQALQALYSSTNGAQWNEQGGWATTNTPCSWYGVTCQAGHVSQLDLSDNNLAGPLPAQLSDLSQLRALSLRLNNLTGSVPVGLGNLTQLQTLDLSANQLTGAVPTQLSGLAALQTLNLSDNDLTGAVPTQLTGLTALQTLNLSSNQLTGQIPPALGGMASLVELNLASNQLTGAIPTQLGNLANLQLLGLSKNALTGAIPPSLGQLSHLMDLALSYNQLSGSIPSELGNLGQLTGLMLGNNRLTGVIPDSLGNLGNITDIWLNSNALSGAVPISLCNPARLVMLELAYNSLSSAPWCMAFLDPFWRETQTMAPTNLTAALGATQATLSWTPIEYQGKTGYYEISYRPMGGAFTVHGVTANKSVSSYVVTGLTPGVKHEFRVRTFTAAHDEPPGYQQNALWSDYAVTPHSLFMPLISRR